MNEILAERIADENHLRNTFDKHAHEWAYIVTIQGYEIDQALEDGDLQSVDDIPNHLAQWDMGIGTFPEDETPKGEVVHLGGDTYIYHFCRASRTFTLYARVDV